MPTTPRWIVTTDGVRPIDQITAELQRLGFRIEAVLTEIGSITATASATAARSARRVAGVVDVTRDAPIDLGPPESSW